MLGFIKHLLCKTPQPPEDPTPVAQSTPVAAPSWPPPPSPAGLDSRPRTLAQPNGGRKCIEVSLQKILAGLPLELQARVRQAEVGELAISIPLERVLAQLSRGAIKISFGDLRRAAPGVFSPDNDRDQVQVSLPLGEILGKLNPALMTRRRVQRQVEVPPEVTSPFDENGQAAESPSAPLEPEVETPAAPAANPLLASRQPRGGTDAIRRMPSASPATTGPSGRLFNSAPLASPPTPPGAPLRLASTPPAPPAAANRSTTPISPITMGGSSKSPTEHICHPVPSTGAGGSSDSFLVPLSALAETWPDAIRREILTLRLVEAEVALPATAIEQALKQGRINFSWKTIRSWLRPPSPSTFSPLDATVLELPLKIVAPLFLARQRAASKAKPQVSVDEEIPNLFFGFPQPEAASPANAAPAQSSQTNYYVWDESHDTVRVSESETRRGPTPGTKFVAKYATPNEVVSRAAGLDGVVGALIALPDGLMVANRLPPDLNGETIAAFLPQIFGKVSQCTKELRMGELNNLHFTVGNVPWKIFRVHAIFFAAFGRAGEPLPTAQLAALAAELDHKPK
jgi:predicted regulator of Ras-like GTPase activity (Roadblock/LC7/MglB family)